MDDINCRTFFLGHRCHFESRYDFSEPILAGLKSCTGYELDEFRRKTYVCDVCTSCGKVVHRPPKEGA